MFFTKRSGLVLRVVRKKLRLNISCAAEADICGGRIWRIGGARAQAVTVTIARMAQE